MAVIRISANQMHEATGDALINTKNIVRVTSSTIRGTDSMKLNFHDVAGNKWSFETDLKDVEDILKRFEY